MSVFIKKPLQKKSLWQKIWHKQIPENLVIELNNLFAGKQILDVASPEVSSICSRYDAVTLAQSQRRFLGYYHQYLQKCLEDKKLTEREIAELAHLKNLLGLPDRLIKQTHTAIAGRLYGEEYEKRIADGSLSIDEQQFLQQLSANLLLSKERQEEIRAQQTGKRVDELLKEIMEDERITPEEEKSFNTLAQNLGYLTAMEGLTKRMYERYKLYWRLENEALPEVKSGLNLQKGEQSCFIMEANWYEARKPSRNKDLNILALGIRMSDSVGWREGYENEIEENSENWELVDNGTLILTDKRIVFIGDKGEQVIDLRNIYNYVPYKDGIRIEQETGSNPIIELKTNADILAILINRIFQESVNLTENK